MIELTTFDIMKNNGFSYLLSGTTAAFFANVITYPIDVCRTLVATTNKTSL